MNTRREKILNIRFSEADYSQLDERRHGAGSESCAGYVRRRALEPEIGTGAIAELIGQVGLTLNALDTAPELLDHLSSTLKELVLELRKLKRS